MVFFASSLWLVSQHENVNVGKAKQISVTNNLTYKGEPSLKGKSEKRDGNTNVARGHINH